MLCLKTGKVFIFISSYLVFCFCIVGAGAHSSIFMIKDYDCSNNYDNLLDRVLHHREVITSHLNWVCIFLGLFCL